MVEASARVKRDDEQGPGRLSLFFRLTRVQFIPLIILPGMVGTVLAFSEHRQFNLYFLSLVMFGIILLHLGANAIDDCYDYQNGVDQVANSMFPRNFGAWKPLPRGYLSLREGKSVSLGLFGSSLAIGLYFGYVVGPWAFVLALVGFLLAFFYCAPPLKLDYRGFGLGELAIFFSFGPIPVLGAYYVQTGLLSLSALLVSIPIGLMTVTILIDHDLIFYEVYEKSGKLSLATRLGRKRALQASLVLTLLCFTLIFAYVALHLLPVWSLAAPLFSGAVLSRKWRTYSEASRSPPYYVPFTLNSLIANWLFTLLIALTLFLV
jgi:1,4-dihydroxy-2-naphthoate octaprenyltransferase